MRYACFGIAVSAAFGIQLPCTAQTRDPFSIAGRSVGPGERADIDISVPAGASDPATYVPVSVFHGGTEGPVLALTAGVHGYEYPPILAAQKLLDRIDPPTLAGTVILVRLAHVEAFEQRVPYVNPFDRKNLNRVFPGKADGTQAERIAWTLTTEVIRRCDLHVELHGGDGAEWLEEFVGIYGGTLAAAQYETARKMGLALGFRNAVKYSMNTKEQVDRGRSLNRQAVADGKPTVLVEIGENGRRDDAFVDTIVEGVLNLLRVLQMAPGEPAPPRKDTRWFDDTASANAATTGIFTPVATTARSIRKGDLIGKVRDYRGRVLEEIVSEVDGYLMYGLAGPPVRAGDTVGTIALPARGPL
ncbi:MAG TPA: M14 family metallopeptidase [Vicinamibacteria bacterium]